MKRVDPYYDTGYHSTHYKALMWEDEYFWARAEIQARVNFTPEQRNLRIFEYGCGIGQGIACLPNAAGWDIGTEAREACRRRNLRVYDDIDDVPRRAWDIVMCCHVLEHLEQPLEALRLMLELVAEGGSLCLILPRERHSRPPIRPDINQHLYCWNFQTINNLLFRAGWEVYRNEERFMLGWRAFLPIRRLLGREAYYWASKAGGVLRRNGELIIWSRPKPAAS